MRTNSNVALAARAATQSAAYHAQVSAVQNANTYYCFNLRSLLNVSQIGIYSDGLGFQPKDPQQNFNSGLGLGGTECKMPASNLSRKAIATIELTLPKSHQNSQALSWRMALVMNDADIATCVPAVLGKSPINYLQFVAMRLTKSFINLGLEASCTLPTINQNNRIQAGRLTINKASFKKSSTQIIETAFNTDYLEHPSHQIKPGIFLPT